MNRLLVGVVAAASVALVGAAPAIAVPVQWAGNGHWYDLVLFADKDWNQANADVATKADLGLDWHLATITSQAEQDFIASTLIGLPAPLYPPIREYWIGGFQPPNSAGEPGANWQWVTGELFVYTSWGPGEPNNSGEEDHIALDNRYSWNWNDNTPSVNGVIVGYVAEAPVPEPGTMVLLGAGLAGLAARARKRRSS